MELYSIIIILTVSVIYYTVRIKMEYKEGTLKYYLKSQLRHFIVIAIILTLFWIILK
ncbi:hypothetical protein [Marinitoga aeolica]|uniref:Uncharacterized protein n=1 Tax=Marinitoga aeolica TaxID=2809031 RepID=A0ABY8PSI4_9BACT|nr:hypothetical protein [Marinitoga aeolica]WGS65468.1 hypothetical protein JRV97_02605 [Marinitoga aeolica]